ncbi:MAG: hypothetical protein K1000chlam2_00537 [Chlamydiae bacterium]|nr:hypothetical protein [Chlamydiota bacterium]
MKTSALIVCKGFIDRCQPPMQSGLSQLLSSEDQAKLQQVPPLVTLEPELLKWDLLDHIHFSWLAPYLRTLAESEIRLFLSTLAKEQSQGLQKILGFENHFPHLTKTSKSALRKVLYAQVTQNQDLVPIAFLPDHPMNRLLQLSPTVLRKLIRFLGLHDLSFEMRQIISTKELKTIFNALPKHEGGFLGTLMLHQEPLVFKRLFLQKWDGSKENLLKLLDERGLHRLAHVLYRASESLLWYVTHRLEMHQGNILLKYKEKPAHARAEDILTGQVKKILEFLKKGEAP